MMNDWEDVNDDEEEDFVPEDCDDDEEGDDVADDYDAEDNPEDFPSILQGQLFLDERKRICYKQDGTFCLVCKNSFPSKNFTFEAPVIDSPLVFVGWVHDPSRRIEFEVVFSRELMSDDPLQIQLLEAQENIPLCQGTSTRTKSDHKYTDDNCNEKKRGSFKAPPLHSFKEDQDSSARPSSSRMEAGIKSKFAEGDRNLRKSSSDDAKIGTKPSIQDVLFIVSGSQIGNNPTDSPCISFRGAYRCPSEAFVERLHLICSIQILDESISAPFAGGTATVAAASKKRIGPGSDYDDLCDGSAGVAYQEVIDLHDDSRLSTEELRNRYYGSGEKKGKYGNNTVDSKRQKVTSVEGSHKKGVEGDDNDDASGF